MADIVDSYFNLVDTTAQVATSNLVVPNIAANSVSAGTSYADNNFVAGLNTNRNPYAEMYVEATANLTNVTALQAFDCKTSGANLVNFTQTSGTLTYTGVVTATFAIHARGNLQSTNAHNGFVVLYKNSTQLAPSGDEYNVAANTVSKFVAQAVTQLKPNDTVSMKIQNLGGVSALVEVKNASIVAYTINWS